MRFSHEDTTSRRKIFLAKHAKIAKRITNERTLAIYTYDANGNTSELINASSGSIEAHYEYETFGNTIITNNTLVNDNYFRFSSKYFDIEYNVYCFGYRYYDLIIGRWISRDLIESINPYEMLWNNPLKYTDPDGREPRHWPPGQEPQGTDNIFAICSRQLEPKGLIEGIVFGTINSFGG